MCFLIKEFNIILNKKNSFKFFDKKILLYDKNNKIYSNFTRINSSNNTILFNHFYNLISDEIILICLNELFDDNYINITNYNLNYYCDYITELGKIKMQNGGFLKEYNDKIEKISNKIFTYCISTITLVYTIKEIFFN